MRRKVKHSLHTGIKKEDFSGEKSSFLFLFNFGKREGCRGIFN